MIISIIIMAVSAVIFVILIKNPLKIKINDPLEDIPSILLLLTVALNFGIHLSDLFTDPIPGRELLLQYVKIILGIAMPIIFCFYLKPRKQGMVNNDTS